MMSGFYEKDTAALHRAREAEMMQATRDHTAKGAKPMPRDLGPITTVHNNGYEGVHQAAILAPFMPHESPKENAGREQALRIVGAIR